MMRFAAFASGSTGNCSLLTDGEDCLLIDAGISMRRIFAALSGEGVAPQALGAVLVTHEHSDHISGLPMLTKHCGVPVLAPRTVASRLSGMFPELEGCIHIIPVGESFAVGGFRVTAFHTPHDTMESVGYRVEKAGESFGLCTDLGTVTEEVLSSMSGVTMALIEANHDEEMLRYGSYPVYLKRRILSERGHLSNDSSAKLAAALAECGTKKLILGHLSRENNTPRKAREAVSKALEHAGLNPELKVAPPFGVCALEV